MDVNAGCGEYRYIDYVGYEASPQHFLAVITGNSSGLSAGYPVLQSTRDDMIMFSFCFGP